MSFKVIDNLGAVQMSERPLPGYGPIQVPIIIMVIESITIN